MCLLQVLKMVLQNVDEMLVYLDEEVSINFADSRTNIDIHKKLLECFERCNELMKCFHETIEEKENGLKLLECRVQMFDHVNAINSTNIRMRQNLIQKIRQILFRVLRNRSDTTDCSEKENSPTFKQSNSSSNENIAASGAIPKQRKEHADNCEMLQDVDDEDEEVDYYKNIIFKTTAELNTVSVYKDALDEYWSSFTGRKDLLSKRIRLLKKQLLEYQLQSNILKKRISKMDLDLDTLKSERCEITPVHSKIFKSKHVHKTVAEISKVFEKDLKRVGLAYRYSDDAQKHKNNHSRRLKLYMYTREEVKAFRTRYWNGLILHKQGFMYQRNWFNIGPPYLDGNNDKLLLNYKGKGSELVTLSKLFEYILYYINAPSRCRIYNQPTIPSTPLAMTQIEAAAPIKLQEAPNPPARPGPAIVRSHSAMHDYFSGPLTGSLPELTLEDITEIDAPVDITQESSTNDQKTQDLKIASENKQLDQEKYKEIVEALQKVLRFSESEMDNPQKCSEQKQTNNEIKAVKTENSGPSNVNSSNANKKDSDKRKNSKKKKKKQN